MARVRDDPLDEATWLVGRLVWINGEGRILWGENLDSAPLGGHRQSPPPGQRAAPDVFRSDPLPRALFFNASANLQLDLYIKNERGATASGDCREYHIGSDFGFSEVNNGLRVSILAGTELLAGGLDYQQISNPKDVAPPPTGFLRCRYRMPVEIARLPAGTVLTLQLNYSVASQPGSFYGPYHFGTGGAAQSELRLRFFDATDAYYRDPARIDPNRAPRDAGKEPDLRGLLAGLGLGLVTLVAPRRGGRRTLVLLLAAGLLGAGCVGRPSSEPQAPASQIPTGTVDSTIEPAQGSVLASNETGGVAGETYDTHGVPIQGAHVLLVGTEHADRTDPFGRFSFSQVLPAEYSLRVDAEGFHSLETPVRIVANNITRIVLELPPLVDRPPESRPHAHAEYWEGANRLRVFDDAVTDAKSKAFFLPHQTPTGPRLVNPGTHLLEVNVTWSGGSELGLMVQPNNDPSAANWSVFLPRPSGVPFRIQATWEMTDGGHQPFSTWTFRLYQPWSHQQQAPPPTLPVKVTIDIVRGSLPLEPGHPDYWQGRTELALAKNRPHAFYFYKTSTDVPLSPFRNGGCYLDLARPAEDDLSKSLYAFLGTLPHVVPQGATILRVNATFNRPAGATAANQYSWDLWYKPGNEPLTAFSSTAGVYKKAAAATRSPDGRTFDWRIPLTALMADGVYAKKSVWQLVATPTDYVLACTDLYANPTTPPSLTWSAAATRA